MPTTIEQQQNEIEQTPDAGDVYQGGQGEQVQQGAQDAGEQHERSEGSSEQSEGQGEQKQQQQAPKQSSEELMAAALDKLAARLTPKQEQQQAPQRQMTQEEINKLLNPVVITADMLKGLGIAEPSEEHVKAYQTLVGMITKHHNSLASLREEALMRKIGDYAAPMERFYQEQAATQQKQQFYKEFPKLEKFDKFVKFAASQVNPRSESGEMKTVQQVKKEISEMTKSLLKEVGIDSDADTGENGGDANLGAPVQNGNTVPRMASLSTGGRSGGQQQKGAANNPDADIYS